MKLLILATNMIEPTYNDKLLDQVAYLRDIGKVQVDLEVDLPLADIETNILTRDYDCVLPLTVYEYSEDGKQILQFNKKLFQLLEYHRTPYIGNDLLTHYLINDKALTGLRSGMALPNQIITRQLWTFNPDLVKKTIGAFQHLPFIVKPNTLSSSIGITEHSVIREYGKAFSFIHTLFSEFPYLTEVLLEPFIEFGREFTVSVTGNGNKRLTAVTAMTSNKKEHTMYSFSEKNKDYKNRSIQYSANIDPKLKLKLEVSAVHLAAQLGLRDYCRFDFMLDLSGQIFLIDANAMPFLGLNYMFEYVAEGTIQLNQILGLLLAASANRIQIQLPSALTVALPSTILEKVY